MDDIKPTPEDLTRDLRADLAALLRATPEAQWEWGEDDLWEFAHLAKAAGVAGVRRALAAETCLSEIRDSIDRLKAVIGRGIGPFRGTTWTHDIPKDPAGLEQCVERLRRTDGTHADAAVIVWEQCQALVREIDQLRAKEAESNG